MGGRVSKVIDLYDHYGALFEQAEHDLGGLLIEWWAVRTTWRDCSISATTT